MRQKARVSFCLHCVRLMHKIDLAFLEHMKREFPDSTAEVTGYAHSCQLEKMPDS